MFDFIPIEMRGMSVFSAIGFISGGVLSRWFYKQDVTHTNKIAEMNNCLGSMKVDIAETNAIVKGLRSAMNDMTINNRQVIQAMLDGRKP